MFSFQFPSNGKVLSDAYSEGYITEENVVSIPFHRESPFGLLDQKFLLFPTKDDCFNSLPPGKSFRTGGQRR